MRKLILLADESATVQQLVKLAFADEAIEVLSAPSVSAARDCLNQRTPDLILIDPLLPDGDALALVRSIRSTIETSRIPVVILMPASVRPERIIGASVDAVLAKPFESIDLLVTTVRELINRSSLVAAPRPRSELSTIPLEEMESSDAILEIDFFEWPAPDPRVQADPLLASLPESTLEALADKVASRLLQRLRELPADETRHRDLETLLHLLGAECDARPSKNTSDIDEVIENPDH